MLERLRKEPSALLLKIFSENLLQNSYRSARERLAARPSGPYRKLRILKTCVTQDVNPPRRFNMASSPYSIQHFRNFVLFMLGELPVQRTKAFHDHRSAVGSFRNNSFCKRSCLFCVLNSDKVVLDSEWHWIFECGQFSSLRAKYPHFSDVLRTIRENSMEKSYSVY